jgi:hypothetical protein
VTTLGIRVLCIPVVVYQLRSAAKLSVCILHQTDLVSNVWILKNVAINGFAVLQLMRPEMERINAEIKDSVSIKSCSS